MNNDARAARLRGGLPWRPNLLRPLHIIFADFSIITGHGKDSIPAARYFNYYKLYRNTTVIRFEHQRYIFTCFYTVGRFYFLFTYMLNLTLAPYLPRHFTPLTPERVLPSLTYL